MDPRQTPSRTPTAVKRRRRAARTIDHFPELPRTAQPPPDDDLADDLRALAALGLITFRPGPHGEERVAIAHAGRAQPQATRAPLHMAPAVDRRVR